MSITAPGRPTPALDALRDGIVVLDGGLSNALEGRGHTLGGDLWTARLLRDEPEEIAAVHRAYFESGAQVATTASYQASIPGLVAAGADEREAERLIRLSVRLAKEVAAEGSDRRVAASVGPYGAMLADGSEYRGYEGRVPAQVLREFHGPRLDLLLEEEPDLLAVETIPDLVEAEVIAELLLGVDVPTWVSFSVAEGRTRAGQPWDEAFGVLAGVDTVVAVGVNCCDPREATAALSAAASASGKPGVCYPNTGQDWQSGQGGAAGVWTGEASWSVDAASAWVAAGAALIGGCCGVGPEQIRALAGSLKH